MQEAIGAAVKRHVIDNSIRKIKVCLSLLNDEQIHWQPNEHCPAISNLILHLNGNVRLWILKNVFDKPFERDRDHEFKMHGELTKNDLVSLLDNLAEDLSKSLSELKGSLLERKHIIQGFKETGISAILHSMEHFSYHTGQIVQLTKIITNKDLGFYPGITSE